MLIYILINVFSHSAYAQKSRQDDELHWLDPTHEVTQFFGHLVLQDNVTNQNHYISAKTVPMTTKPGFIFSSSHCSCTILF